MEARPKPNFFIVGAPKSGTTALYSYLSQHPQIFMCSPKEPQFFAADIRGDQRVVRTLSDYLDLFRNARSVVIGEASTCYLGSLSAPHEIRSLSPEARIVIMLRNPIEVMYAEHSECLYDGTEHILDFRLALGSDEPRTWRSGRLRGQPVTRLSYRELVKFSQQVNRFINVFGRSNVHVIVYDDFADDPRLAYKEVLAFLGVWPNHKCSFNVVHANRQIRSTWCQDLLRHPPRLVRGFSHTFLPGPVRRTLGSCLNRLNTKFVPRPMLDQDFRRQLELEFMFEVQQLSKVIDRDLCHWVAGEHHVSAAQSEAEAYFGSDPQYRQ